MTTNRVGIPSLRRRIEELTASLGSRLQDILDLRAERAEELRKAQRAVDAVQAAFSKRTIGVRCQLEVNQVGLQRAVDRIASLRTEVASRHRTIELCERELEDCRADFAGQMRLTKDRLQATRKSWRDRFSVLQDGKTRRARSRLERAKRRLASKQERIALAESRVPLSATEIQMGLMPGEQREAADGS